MKGEVSQSKEDYLERIYQLMEGKGYARVSDIAEELGFSRPSVTAMVQQLSREGYLNYEKYRGFSLTQEGERVARSIRNRHRILSELFELIGVDHKYVEKDVEGIEHHISDETLKGFRRLVEHLKLHPLGEIN